MSLVELLARAPLGRLFLANLHFGLTQSPPHLQLNDLEPLWKEVWGTLTPATQPDQARHALFNLFYLKANWILRFRRPPTVHLGESYNVHTTVTPHDLVEFPEKSVISKSRLSSYVSRIGKDQRDWSDQDCRKLCDAMESASVFTGEPFAHTFGIFWATPEQTKIDLSADELRDRLGLVHIGRGEPIIQLTFRCTATAPAHVASPTVIEATAHRRFLARWATPTTRPEHGYAVDLNPLRNSKTVMPGVLEVTMSSLDMSHLDTARFVGRTQSEPDISPGPHFGVASDQDDEAFAAITSDPFLPTALKDLSTWLEGARP